MVSQQLIAAMSDPGFYPHRPQRVTVLQTHISVVFLADDLVYKIKKPVNLGFLDFSTIDARKYFCHKEVTLNRRLAPDIYLGVFPIYMSLDKSFSLDKGKNVAEYAVVMKRLEEKLLFKELLQTRQLTEAHMKRLAKTLFLFHEKAETGSRIDFAGSLEVIRQNHVENFLQTEKFIGKTVSADRFALLWGYVDSFMRQNEALFLGRVTKNRIRDCHGDLHLEHICDGDPIAIYDCIEFNERLRFGDVASEVAFLAMDLEHNARPDLAHAFCQAYIRQSDDEEIEALLPFYKCYRAHVRAKVLGIKSIDPLLGMEVKKEAEEKSARYFSLAADYACTLAKPTLFLMTGLSGTGKSTVAKMLGEKCKVDLVSSDVTRKQLCGLSPETRVLDPFGKGLYDKDMTEKTYESMRKQAHDLLISNRSVILDATHAKRIHRDKVQDLAKSQGADFFTVHTIANDAEVLGRLKVRATDMTQVSDGRIDIYQQQKHAFSPPDEIPKENKIVVDTSGSIDECAEKILACFYKKTAGSYK